ncbi:hypothetical protein BCR37DRAFT_267135 [Protomyces lactucae-debilis]|uniref:Uncharacterized protein n=1 Tax=Protomyces lactucae-debilis TaxID=2754530 RepID=A0A1Y2FKD5_PROLT|nr:uncharacterized protein BCR37DRAFT_267135 [Protomyces lactucae-debilis]ORY84442.1 hypothetical protein BCR37DRAFT_267135 [Protomyces lactucae-debilis]
MGLIWILLLLSCALHEALSHEGMQIAIIARRTIALSNKSSGKKWCESLTIDSLPHEFASDATLLLNLVAKSNDLCLQPKVKDAGASTFPISWSRREHGKIFYFPLWDDGAGTCTIPTGAVVIWRARTSDKVQFKRSDGTTYDCGMVGIGRRSEKTEELVASRTPSYRSPPGGRLGPARRHHSLL